MADPKQHLHMDRRLLRRRGFVTEEERDAFIANLPDVSDKGERIDVPGAPGAERSADEEPDGDVGAPGGSGPPGA